MLSKHRVMSPATRRIAGAATLALSFLALGATASGTQAAKTIRSGVERVTGVEVASVERSAAAALTPMAAAVAQVAPAAVLAPASDPVRAPATAPVEAVARSTVTDEDGKVRQIVVKRAHRNGPMTEVEIAAMVATMPEMVERTCGTGGPNPRQIILNERDGTKRRIIICTDRVERIGIEAATQAERATIEGKVAARAGLTAALVGLRAARQTMATQAGLTAEQRLEAVQGIDHGIREIEQEIASEG